MTQALTEADRRNAMNKSEASRVEDLADADMTRADMTDALNKIDNMAGVKTPMGRGAEILVTVEDKEVARNEIESAGYNVEDDGENLRVYFTVQVECEHDCDNPATHDVVISSVNETVSAFVCDAHKEAHESHGVLAYSEPATDELVERHYPRTEE
jgi:hypothetical protein